MLKRDISSTSVLIAAAGGMVGSGWLFSPFLGAQVAGSNILISWIIAAVFMVFIALPLCELGAMFPISGGMINYPTLTHGPALGFLFALTAWLSYVVMTPIEVQAILQYAGHFFPSLIAANKTGFVLSGIGYGIAIAIMFFVAFLNSFGIKLLANSNKYLSFFKFLLPTIAVVSLWQVGSFDNVSLHLSEKKDWDSILSALSTAGVIFAFTGFQNGLVLAGEVQRPSRNVPLAILGAVLVGFVLYFCLQLSFIVGVPKEYLSQGWSALHFPGGSGPFVGLTLLLGLNVVAYCLMFDAVLSPFATTLVYTAATSRILYGMALSEHLPTVLLKLNRYKIPYITLWINCLMGLLAFLPFHGWQKMVTFLSSTSILSYVIGPLCLLSCRKLYPTVKRPFKLSYAPWICYITFYICNLMLYWCGFSILWKLDLILTLGLMVHWVSQKGSWAKNWLFMQKPVQWFLAYLFVLLVLSYYGPFGGGAVITFPWDAVLLLLFSVFFLRMFQEQTAEHCVFSDISKLSVLQEVFGTSSYHKLSKDESL